MKNLKNALLLKQLYQLKSLSYHYTSLTPYTNKESFTLPHNLESLAKQASECHLCPLSKSRKSVVFGEGNPNAEVLFVGEAPGAMEDNVGKPFLGSLDRLLSKMIENVLMLSKEDVYLTYLLKCHPYNNTPITTTQAYTCNPYLLKQIDLIQPKVIVALGATAYHYLTGDSGSITQIRGVIRKEKNYAIVPTYDLGYILKNPTIKKEVLDDLLKVKSLLAF